MRVRGGRKLLVLGLGLGLAISTAAGQPPAARRDMAESKDWWSGLFGTSKPKDGPKVGVAPGPAAVPPGSTVADRAAEQDRLMNAFLRRQDACDRLRDIALGTNNNALYEEAGRLEDLAWKIYQQRSSKLLGVPVTPSATASTPEESESPVDVERETVDMLRAATPGGALPPRLRPGSRTTPSQASRTPVKGEEER